MEDKKFRSILTILVPRVIELIVNSQNQSKLLATEHFTNQRYIVCRKRRK